MKCRSSSVGYISREHTIWCGACSRWHRNTFEPNKAAMALAMRRLGWIHTKECGWVCPLCAKTRQKE